jgi:beta-galactosidase
MDMMNRVETKMMDGWEFTLKKPEDQNFKPVKLPHDWAIHAPINRDMRQGKDQGFRDRFISKLLVRGTDGIYGSSGLFFAG